MDEAERSELLQVYAVERQDHQNNQVVVFAIIAVALTYFVASAAFLLGNYSNGSYKHVPSVVLLGSPLIPLALLSALIIRMGANVIRVKHITKIEELLTQNVPENFVSTPNIPSGIRDSSDLWKIKARRSWFVVYAVLGLATNIPIFAIALGYTFVVLIPGPWPWDKALIFGIYCLVIAMQIAGLLIPDFHPRFKTTFISD